MCLLHVQVRAQFGRLRPNKTRETMVLFVPSASGRISVFDIEVPPPPIISEAGTLGTSFAVTASILAEI